jgi:regulator of sigma E protease
MLKDASLFQIVVALCALGALIAWHEAGHYLAARLLGMRVMRYVIGFGPRVLTFKRGEIEYGISALPLGGYVQIFGTTPYEEGALGDARSYINRPRWQRFLVIGAGPFANYALATFLFVAFIMLFPQGPVVVVDVQEDSAAAAAGITTGDVLYRADGREFASDADIAARLTPNAAGVVSVVVSGRGAVDVASAGASTGLVVEHRPERPGIGRAVYLAARMCVVLSVNTLTSLAALFRGSDDVTVSGPLGIGQQITKAVARGAGDLLFMLAYLSVALGLMNLLPIPALDGIKMLFLSVEGALRRDLNPAVQVWVHAAGFVLLFGLMLVMTAFDAVRMFGA